MPIWIPTRFFFAPSFIAFKLSAKRKKIVGMRHILVHVYYDINADAVWRVAQSDLEPLLKAINAALD